MERPGISEKRCRASGSCLLLNGCAATGQESAAWMKFLENICGMIDLYGVPLKPYYPFVYFGDLYRKSNECFCMVGASQKSSAMSFGAEHTDSRTKGSGESSGIFATAATDGKTAGVLLSNYEGLDTRVLLHFNGMEKVRNIRIRTTDRFNTDRSWNLRGAKWNRKREAFILPGCMRWWTV